MPKIPINEKAAPTSFGLISFDKIDLTKELGREDDVGAPGACWAKGPEAEESSGYVESSKSSSESMDCDSKN